MSTVAEIEAALPELSLAELRRVESVLRDLQLKASQSQSIKPLIATLDSLQSRLALDEQKVAAWTAAVHEGRR